MPFVNPGVYFRDMYPQYARAAKICELVYDNIDKLFKPYHDAGSTVMSVITLGGDYGVIRCRCLLGYYKPTIGGTSEDVIESYNEFKRLMRGNGLEYNFTAGELSDAEHFFASAVITSIPLLGLVANPAANLAWDFVKPGFSAVNKNVTKTLQLEETWSSLLPRIWKDMEYDVNQLTGPDLAGHRYGLAINYFFGY